jgi:hypothetical protein
MAGRKPDFRVMFVEDKGKGRKIWFKVGAAWRNEESGSVGVEVNIGLPLMLQPHTKRVLVENKEDEGEEAEFRSAA